MKVARTLLWVVIGIVVVLTFILIFMPRAEAATNINAAVAEHMAWNDAVGWIDFYQSDTVFVNGSQLTGYATTQTLGEISLDCATTSSGNICGQSNYGVTNNVSGVLAGYAWNDVIGWISMNCLTTPDGCAAANYSVIINPITGDFSGWAWNDAVGWISFNGASYKVNTAWRAIAEGGYLESSIFDTRVIGGATLNSIVWLGIDPGSDSRVDFQIAASNSSTGPWNWAGPDGTNATYYGAPCDTSFSGGQGRSLPGTPICVNPNHVKNNRYIRYRVRVQTDTGQTVSPIVDSIILNWSR